MLEQSGQGGEPCRSARGNPNEPRPVAMTSYGEGISFRVGRYVGLVSVERDGNSVVELQKLMYELANNLIASLHELAVKEGVLPTLSQSQAIQAVIDHIEHGMPIERLAYFSREGSE